MDPEYLALLEELLMAQGGGFGDPYAPQGGFPAPPMPNGKMPQYRTQGSGYMSDGTVRDLFKEVSVNPDDFSADAFFDLAPDLKGILARAVADAGHDPYAAYDLVMNEDPYQKMLIDVVNDRLGAAQAQVNPENDVNMDGQLDAQDVSLEDYLAAAQQANQGRIVSLGGTGDIDMYGDERQRYSPYQAALESQLQAIRGDVDDFLTQSAPSQERNLNSLDFLWSRAGGMPFPGQGGGALDYAGTSSAFPGQGGGAEGAGFVQSDPQRVEFVRQYLENAGVDFKANRRERDERMKRFERENKTYAQRREQRASSRGRSDGAQRKNDSWYMKVLRGDLGGLPRPAGILG